MTYQAVNTVLWLDIPVLNLDRAIAFYEALLNIPARDRRPAMNSAAFQFAPIGSGFTLIEVENRPPASGILPYLNCNGRLEQALSKVALQGGKVEQGRHSMEPFGYRAVIVDCEGNRLALHSAE
ncbi:MAG: hypothetical protein P8X74_15485 [Reinekea sp.]|jgi:uncharacterized protein